MSSTPSSASVRAQTSPLHNTLDTFTFKPSAYLESGLPLRPLFLPASLRTHFLASASPNTVLNLETCGILCGILKSDALFITRLVIPAQTATSDTCEMTDEGEVELFEYCEKEDVMVLGWIHTHPTQRCFMSSRDLHTQVGYQVMMRESVAVVVAPGEGRLVCCFFFPLFPPLLPSLFLFHCCRV